MRLAARGCVAVRVYCMMCVHGPSQRPTERAARDGATEVKISRELWVSVSYLCAVTAGTDVYSCEVRIHLLTPLGVGNNIHCNIRTRSNFIHMYLRPLHAAAI